MTLRMNRGEWTVQLEGRPGTAKVVTFEAQSPSTQTGGKLGIKQWPASSYRVTIQRNKLTNGGTICAHDGCTAQWRDFDDPIFDEWMRSDRLLLTTPIFATPDTEEGDDKPKSEDEPKEPAPGAES